MILLCAKRGCSGAKNAAIYPPGFSHCVRGEMPKQGEQRDHELRRGAHFDKVDIGI